MAARTETAVTTDLYVEVQQFYARHMQALDRGAAEEWARGFTVDGSFAAPSLPVPVRGREQLAAGVRKAATELAETGEVRRHWLGMLAVYPQDDESLRVRSYAQILAIPRDGQPRVHLSCTCEDFLVREDGELRIRERKVARDDRPV